jgi:hypothetical protein
MLGRVEQRLHRRPAGSVGCQERLRHQPRTSSSGTKNSPARSTWLPGRVVVAGIQRQPGHPMPAAPDPLGQQDGLAVPARPELGA